MSSSHLLTSGTTLLALVAAALLLTACGELPGGLPLEFQVALQIP